MQVETSTPTMLLEQLLPCVSRSFYLSVRILPQRLRVPIGLAYLFCRAADTIADTTLLPRELRRAYLDQYRAVFSSSTRTPMQEMQRSLTDHQGNAAERELLMRLTDCFSAFSTMPNGDQRRIRDLVLTLTQGMQMDLSVFPSEQEGTIGALETRADLERYTYFVAGCVGEFWTRMMVTHVPSVQHWNSAAMEAKGIGFGKGLQLTNVLRDIASDVRIGRCYLPRVDLALLGVRPEELLNPKSVERIQPLLRELLDLTLSHYRDGWAYTLAIPPREWRLRLACAWPLFIGLSTLGLVRRSQRLLDPNTRVKIARLQVYAIMVRSLASVWSNKALDRYYGQLLGQGFGSQG